VPGRHTVFEAEVLGMVLVAELIRTEKNAHSAIIGTDSQVAISRLGTTRDPSQYFTIMKFVKDLEFHQNHEDAESSQHFDPWNW